jgi:hypothetical protein
MVHPQPSWLHHSNLILFGPKGPNRTVPGIARNHPDCHFQCAKGARPVNSKPSLVATCISVALKLVALSAPALASLFSQR